MKPFLRPALATAAFGASRAGAAAIPLRPAGVFG